SRVRALGRTARLGGGLERALERAERVIAGDGERVEPHPVLTGTELDLDELLADLDAVSRVERVLPGHQSSVHARSVSAAEVFDVEPVAGDVDDRVLSRHEIVVE